MLLISFGRYPLAASCIPFSSPAYETRRMHFKTITASITVTRMRGRFENGTLSFKRKINCLFSQASNAKPSSGEIRPDYKPV